jgi:hypothetical protein
VLVTSSSADPLIDLTATVDTGEFASRCRWDDLAPRVPDGGLVEVVVCNNAGVMGATTGRDSEQDWAISYFTLPTPYLPDGADLGPGSPIEGLPRALAFTAPVQDMVACSILLLPHRSGWKETCGEVHGLDVATALIQLDSSEPRLYETTIDDSGLITSARALDAMAPSSGCSVGSAIDLVQAVPVSSIVMGIGCIDDKAGLTTGSVLTQDGPPDGSWHAIGLAELCRVGEVWFTANHFVLQAEPLEIGDDVRVGAHASSRCTTAGCNPSNGSTTRSRPPDASPSATRAARTMRTARRPTVSSSSDTQSSTSATIPSSHQWCPVAATTSIVNTRCAIPIQRQRLVLAESAPNATTAAHATWSDGIAANCDDTPVPASPYTSSP